MGRSLRGWGVALLFVGMLTGSACSRGREKSPRCTSRPPVTPHLFFDAEPNPIHATAIGREPWPAAEGPYQVFEDVFYYERYSDNRGNSDQERNNPRTHFYGHRFGYQAR